MNELHNLKAWWERAMQDRRIARLAFEDDAEGLAPAICASCQQACEKMLKAYLLSKGWTLERTHDLAALGQEARKTLPAVKTLLAALAALSVDFIPSRYPFEFEEDFTGEDAKRAISTVEQLHSLLVDHLPEQTLDR